jgi:hypothetical protein
MSISTRARMSAGICLVTVAAGTSLYWGVFFRARNLWLFLPVEVTRARLEKEYPYGTIVAEVRDALQKQGFSPSLVEQHGYADKNGVTLGKRFFDVTLGEYRTPLTRTDVIAVFVFDEGGRLQFLSVEKQVDSL